MAEVPEPVLPTPIEDDPERGTLLRRAAGRGAAREREAPAPTAARAGAARARRPLVRRDRRAGRHEGERGRAADLPGPREPAPGAPARAGRSRTAPGGVPALPAAARGAPRRPAEGSAAAGDARAPRRAANAARTRSRACKRLRSATGRSSCRASWRPTRRARRWSAGSTPPTTGIAAAAGCWSDGRSDPSLLSRRSSPLSGGGTALGVALSRDGEPEPAAAAQTTEAEVVVTTSEEIVRTRDRADDHRHSQATAPKPPPPKVTAPSTTDGDNDAPATTREGDGRRPRPLPRRPRRSRSPRPSRNGSRPSLRGSPDTTAPTVTITQAPGASVSSSGAQIRFTSNEAGAKLACKLDAAAYSACTSPAVLLRSRRGHPPFLGPRDGQGRERGEAGERRVAVCPAGHDGSHRDPHLDPAGLDDGDERELRLHGERVRRRLRVLARRSCLRRVRQPGLLPVTRASARTRSESAAAMRPATLGSRRASAGRSSRLPRRHRRRSRTCTSPRSRRTRSSSGTAATLPQARRRS